MKEGHYGGCKGQEGKIKSYGEELYQQSFEDYGRDFILFLFCFFKTNGVTEFTF